MKLLDEESDEEVISSDEHGTDHGTTLAISY